MSDQSRPTAKPTHRLVLDAPAPIVLSFVAGLVDVVCYLGLFHTFVAFITGTVIILGEQLIVQDGHPQLKSFVIVGFVVATIFWIRLIRRFEGAAVLVPVLLAAEAAILSAFVVCNIILTPIVNPTDPDAIILALLGVAAMSLQNTLMALSLRHHMPTTVMTGNLVRSLASAIDAWGAARLTEQRASTPNSRYQGLVTYVYVILAFVAGILVGAAGFMSLGLNMILLPALVLLGFSGSELMLRRRKRTDASR